MLLKFGFNIRTQKRTIREGNALIVIKKSMYTVDADKDFFIKYVDMYVGLFQNYNI